MKMLKKELEDKYFGKFIRIIEMKGEPSQTGRIGKVELVDDMGQLHGSWSSLAIIPGEDEFEVVG